MDTWLGHQTPGWGTGHQTPGWGTGHQTPGWSIIHWTPGWSTKHRTLGQGTRHQALDTGHLARHQALGTRHLAETPDWRHHLGHILGPGRAPCTGTLAPALGGGPGTLPVPDTGEPLQQLLHAGKVFQVLHCPPLIHCPATLIYFPATHLLIFLSVLITLFEKHSLGLWFCFQRLQFQSPSPNFVEFCLLIWSGLDYSFGQNRKIAATLSRYIFSL